MTHLITSACKNVKNQSCASVCPVDCISGSEETDQLYINPSLCIDCGACAGVCPVEAIYVGSDLPADLLAYREINAKYFNP
jgi:ferredoxin